MIEQKALSILDTYSGANNYILKLKFQKETNKKFYPTRAQSEYIINFHETSPKVAKKWVDCASAESGRLGENGDMLARLLINM